MVRRLMSDAAQSGVRALCASVLLAASISVGASAQVVVANNLGPGDTFLPDAWLIGSQDGFQFEFATSFVFGGPIPLRLMDFTVPVTYFSGSSDLFTDFLVGSNIASATTVFSQSVSTNGLNSNDEILDTVDAPLYMLQPGQTYWIRLRLDVPSDGQWGWNQNDQGQQGFSFRTWDITDPNNPVDDGWTDDDGDPTPAFRVRAFAAPEPGTVALTGTGLLLLGGLARRRTRRA